MLSIEPIEDFNPFEKYPYLTDIWPIISSSCAQLDTQKTLEEKQKGICLIILNKEVIGLTGFYLNHELYKNQCELSLRWHGVVEKYRGFNYSQQALKLVFQWAHEIFPEAIHMGEYIPVTSYNEYIKKHFQSMGFVQFEQPFNVDWSIYQMICYRVEILKFLNKN